MSKLLQHLKDAKNLLQHGSLSEGINLLDDAIRAYKQQLESSQDIINIQCNEGNWNYDPYMHGMANGMLLTQSIFTDEVFQYLDAPDVWLESLSDDIRPVQALH